MRRPVAIRIRRGQSGTALIEFALVLPLLVVLVFLLIDFGRAFMTRAVIQQAAREGARALATSDVGPAEAVSITKRVAALSGLDSTTVSVSAVEGTPTADQVQVSVSAPFTWLYPGLVQLLGVTGTSSTLTHNQAMHLESP